MQCGLSLVFAFQSCPCGTETTTVSGVPKRISAGLLMFRRTRGYLEVFLAHPGGPFFRDNDKGYWTIPKGEVEPGEELFDTACREFHEEVGMRAEAPKFHPIGSIRQKGGKIVHGWAFEGEWEMGRTLKSVTFELEWPPRSRKMRAFPEIDRAEFFDLREARERIKETQVPFLDRVSELTLSLPRR